MRGCVSLCSWVCACGRLDFLCLGTELDRYEVLGFDHTESTILDFPGYLRHVGRSPRDDHELRGRKPSLNLFQQMAISFVQEIIKKLFL